MPYTTLIFQCKPPLAYITLNRPRVRNRVGLRMAMEIQEVCQRLREGSQVHAVIVTGNGIAFSVGREHLTYPRAAPETVAPLEWLRLHQAASSLASLEMCTIAAINGDALDHGLELALACDLRIASRGLTLGFTDLARGQLPWDGGTQRLPRLVGRARSLEMLLLGRTVDADEACRIGLVNAVVEAGNLMGTADQMALAIVSGGPIALRYAREAVYQGMDLTLEQGLRLEADLNLLLQSTADRAEGIQAFTQKRSPSFKGK